MTLSRRNMIIGTGLAGVAGGVSVDVGFTSHRHATQSPVPPSPVVDGYAESVGNTVVVDKLSLSNGTQLDGARLYYRTLGAPVRDTGGRIVNAALLLHGTTGSSEQFLQPSFAERMFGPGQPLDVQRWFVVMPDALGHGQSSKPSDGLHGRFPAYGYRDMVTAQRRVCTELGLDRLRLVLGTSMGDMQTWLWAGSLPDRLDAAVAVACEPQPVTGRNLLWRRMITRAIRADTGWESGQGRSPGFQAAWPIFSLMINTPTRLAHIADVTQALAQLDEWVDHALHPSDMLYALEASNDYDPRPLLGRIRVPLLAINFDDDELNPAELRSTFDTSHQAPSVVPLNIPAGPDTWGHQTLAHPTVWADQLADFLDRIPVI